MSVWSGAGKLHAPKWKGKCALASNNNNPARIQFIAFRVVGCTVRNPNTDEEEKGVGERVREKGGKRERESHSLQPAFLSLPYPL